MRDSLVRMLHRVPPASRTPALGTFLVFLGFLFLPLAGARSSPASPPSAAPRLRTTVALKADVTAMNRHIDFTGGALDNSPESAALLDEFWTEVQQWVATRLEAGDMPHYIVAEARRDFGRYSPPYWFRLSALRLDGDSVALSASIQSLGTVFILRRSSDGRFSTAMALNRPATWGGRDVGKFAGWQSENATEEAQRRSNFAGPRPLSATELVRLPKEADGARRFAIVGLYAQMAGATRGFQVSIWRWTGTRATPLLVVPLDQMGDEPVIARVGRTRLVLQEKGNFKQLYACGACAGRQMAITVELPPRSARLGSTRSLSPELDLADEFFDRGFGCQPLGNLVAPALARKLRDTLTRMCEEGGGHLGILDTARISRHGQRETLCLITDDLAHARIFTLARQGDRLRITGYQTAPRTACEDKALLKRN